MRSLLQGIRSALFAEKKFSPPGELEQAIREQINEMDRQVSAFNEAFGHLRAALASSTENETQAFERLQHADQLAVTVWEEQMDPILGEALHLAREQSRFAWMGFSVQSHVLRTLYNQLMESKRYLLRHWDELLREQINRLPTERQKSLRILLTDTLQGLILVGVAQAEDRYKAALADLLAARKTQQHPVPQPLSREQFYNVLRTMAAEK